MKRIGFSGATIDRADHLRTDPAAFAAAKADPRARLLALDGLLPVVDGGAIRRLPVSDGELALVGVSDGDPLFVRIGEPLAPSGPSDWDTILSLSPDELALYAAARSLVDWHARHGFCANSGHPTEPYRGGWGRRCSACGAEHFPRVDPVVIMLAEHDGRVLLGRQPRFPPGRYSALAGFVEPGESIEEAVARELHEEAGIAVTRVRYVASQPWPFPSQLMIACIAEASGDALTIDRHELEDGFWATRDEVRAALAGEHGARFDPPGAHAIARTLLDWWVDEQPA